MAFETTRIRRRAIAVSVFPVTNLITAGLCEEGAHSRQVHLLDDKPGLGGHGGQTLERGMSFLRVSGSAPLKESVDQSCHDRDVLLHRCRGFDAP